MNKIKGLHDILVISVQIIDMWYNEYTLDAQIDIRAMIFCANMDITKDIIYIEESSGLVNWVGTSDAFSMKFDLEA